MEKEIIRILIDVPAKNIMFVKVPNINSEFRICNYGYAGIYLVDISSEELNSWKEKLPYAKYEIMGIAKKIIPQYEGEENVIVLRKI